jgi:multiple sugar transport system substrate-binding protein
MDGTLCAVLFAVHAVVLDFNKDMFAAAGRLGDDGLPKGLGRIDKFTSDLTKLQEGGAAYGVSIHSVAGDPVWRIFSSLMGQQDGQFITAKGVLQGDNLDKAVKATADEK